MADKDVRNGRQRCYVMVDKRVTKWQTKMLRNGRQTCYVMADKDVT